MTGLSDAGRVRASRRIVFHGLGALGVAAALAGCGGGDDDTEGGGGGGAEVESGTELTPTADVPVGGGVILTDQKIVVTQPTEGEFKAFTAVCTHQQLLVTSVSDGQIHCNNHGSVYDAATGEVVTPPAPEPLAPVEIEVKGDAVVAV